MIENKKNNSPPRLNRICSLSDIKELTQKNKISSISLRLPTPCNLNCIYCYSSHKDFNKLGYKKNILCFSDLKFIIQQAVELGCKHVSIVGDGEPLLYVDKNEKKDIFDLLDFITDKGCNISLFSNATTLNENNIKRLSEYKLAFIAKQNSLNDEIQNYLTGKFNASTLIHRGIRLLIENGFTDTYPSRLAIHTIICSHNYDDIPTLWREWRKKNIIPYIQVWVPPNKNELSTNEVIENLYVKPSNIKILFDKLAEIDNMEFGYNWSAQETYPIAGMGCNVMLSGCGIKQNGDVQLCAYTEKPVGNIYKSSLKDIISSDTVKKIRTYNYSKIKDGTHYGCRAIALNMTGDRFKKDPFYQEFSRNGGV